VGGVPNIKAAEKWARQSEKRLVRNRDTNTRLKTLYKKALGEANPEVTQSVESQFDKAVKRGIIHKNKAARKKSRLAKAIVRAATTEKPAKQTRGATKKATKKKA
jgi:small subunit ribosomal protein S20